MTTILPISTALPQRGLINRQQPMPVISAAVDTVALPSVSQPTFAGFAKNAVIGLMALVLSGCGGTQKLFRTLANAEADLMTSVKKEEMLTVIDGDNSTQYNLKDSKYSGRNNGLTLVLENDQTGSQAVLMEGRNAKDGRVYFQKKEDPFLTKVYLLDQGPYTHPNTLAIAGKGTKTLPLPVVTAAK